MSWEEIIKLDGTVDNERLEDLSEKVIEMLDTYNKRGQIFSNKDTKKFIKLLEDKLLARIDYSSHDEEEQDI